MKKYLIIRSYYQNSEDNVAERLSEAYKKGYKVIQAVAMSRSFSDAYTEYLLELDEEKYNDEHMVELYK